MSPLFTLEAPCSYREEIRKSRFIAHAAPVASADDALAFFSRHADAAATHNCWAYRIGASYRFNDDGEPGGTAGRPILQAIDGQACDRVAVLVVRWFGGTLLGAGGLVRAYGSCAANCLRQGRRVPLLDLAQAEIACTFAELPLFKARLRDHGAEVVQERFDEQGARLALKVPRPNLEELRRVLADLSRGRSMLEVLDEP
ncbi:thymidylate synthase [Pigmentiphaga sp. NML080357]|uniref:IMPACT family protein n=1 Tax=Pigmentiphaga sp. NML080357 TaxID=2008675 RepID=UPI000B40B75E|nr:YigZ family protein [Pigmentiphaga sp. NML080357]OVZ60727.1 thymidylate synthase [Pigmentiphaga sp. NML080357]